MENPEGDVVVDDAHGEPLEDDDASPAGGKTNAPCLCPPPPPQPFPGNSHPTVGVSPQSACGRIRLERKLRSDGRWAAKSAGWVAYSSVSAERKVDK